MTKDDGTTGRQDDEKSSPVAFGTRCGAAARRDGSPHPEPGYCSVALRRKKRAGAIEPPMAFVPEGSRA